jgi:iron complex outermembrane receptor protein
MRSRASKAARNYKGVSKAASMRVVTVYFWCLALCAFGSSGVVADDAEEPGAADHTLSEITVSARKRDEMLEKVPASVTVVTDTDLQATYTGSLVDLTSAAPNVVFHTVGEFGHSSSLDIRGVGGGGANLDTDPAVAIYVDGLYQTVNSINLESLVGIDSIEVLRGPQGTLFGRNAFAGAITVTTKNPTGQSDGEVGVTIGNYGRKNLNADLDFIVTDALSGRVDLAWINSDGFYTNVLDDNRSIGGDANLTIRPTLVLEAADRLKFQFKYNFVDDQSGPTPNKYDLDPPVSGFGILNPGQYANWGSTHLGPNGTEGPYSMGFTDICKCNFIKINSPSLETDYDSPWGTLTSISGYQYVAGTIQTDATGTAVPLLRSELPYTVRVFTQELRSLSQVGSRFKLITGVYYLQDTLNEGFLESILLGSISSTTWQDSRQQRKSAAAFSEGEYTLTEKLRLTAGMRYTDEEKKFQFGESVPASIKDGEPIIAPAYGYTPLSASWHNVAPKVSLDYQWTPDTMLYGTWSRGFKAGGFQALASTASAAGPYGDETMDATEIGIKSFFGEHRARISADIFYENIEGLQRSIVFLDNGISNNLTRNAANSISKGVELEAAFLPVDALTIKADAGYLDAYYTRFCANFVATNANRPACGNEPGEVDNTNLVPSNAPRWTLALAAEYRKPVGEAGALNFHIDESYTSSLWTADDNEPISYRASEALLNAAIKFSAAGDRYSVSIWGHNLTDRVVTEAGVTAYPLFSFWNPTPPRTFGLILEAKLQSRRH